MRASYVIAGIIAVLPVLAGISQQYRAGAPINAPEPDRAAVHVFQNVHMGQRMPALEDAEPEPDFEVGKEEFEPSLAGSLADQCPAWQHGTPVHQLPLVRKLLVEMAYSDESIVHATWSYLAALHGRVVAAFLPRRGQTVGPYTEAV